jgi:DNA-directed RNA polymerase subunit H (RpoH/RPB5)
MNGVPSLADKFCSCVVTLEQLLRDRGYELKQKTDFEHIRKTLRSLDLADANYAQALLNSHIIEATNNASPESSDDVKVYWLCGKIGVNSPTLEKVREALANQTPTTDDDGKDKGEADGVAVGVGNTNTIIFVTFEGASVSAPAKNSLSNIPATIEFFDSCELQCNITEHELQPKFKMLTQSEAENIKHIYGARNEQIPKLLWTDPIRRYFGLRRGQMLQCKRIAENGIDPMYVKKTT